MSTQENTSANTSLEKEASNSGTTYDIVLTPEQIKRIEENRLKAQAKLREKQKQKELQNNSTSSDTQETTNITNNVEEKKLRPMKKFQNYAEYDLSKIKDSRGGFLFDEQSDENSKKRKLESPEPEFEALEPCKKNYKNHLIN